MAGFRGIEFQDYGFGKEKDGEMKTKEFLKKHDACPAGARWALSISEEMADVWEAMIEHGKHDWLVWTATRPGVFSDSILRKLACRFVRETPLADGRKVWDLLTDERSRKAVEVAEAYADGKATYEELDAACAAADAACAAYATAHAAFAVACMMPPVPPVLLSVMLLPLMLLPMLLPLLLPVLLLLPMLPGPLLMMLQKRLRHR